MKTPREWYLLASEMDEAGMAWEWVGDGNAIGVVADRVWVSVHSYNGSWIVEVEDRVKVGGYYDPPEYRYAHDYLTNDIEDVILHIESLTREAENV
jgi:hypothetical protein